MAGALAGNHGGYHLKLFYDGSSDQAHNDPNILYLGGKITGVMEAFAIVKEWLEAKASKHRICLNDI